MNWIESISKTLEYIENHICEDISIEDISKNVYMSSLYLQKGFSILCGYTLSEYIRNRKLALAGSEVLNSNKKIIDIALKYGYDSPDSFTKAFTRFHGVTPNQIRKNGGMIKEFIPLKLNLDLKGGYTMEYKIEEKESFKVIGLAKVMKYDTAFTEVPKLWQEYLKQGKLNNICPRYGVNIDAKMSGNEFEYIVCDDYIEGKMLPDEFVVREIPKHTWAVFPCIGRSDKSIAEMNQKIFKEWLPNSTNYEIAEGLNIEMYTDPADFKNGTLDEKYYCEVWIPIKKK